MNHTSLIFLFKVAFIKSELEAASGHRCSWMTIFIKFRALLILQPTAKPRFHTNADNIYSTVMIYKGKIWIELTQGNILWIFIKDQLGRVKVIYCNSILLTVVV